MMFHPWSKISSGFKGPIINVFSSVQSLSMFDSLWPNQLQHARPLCPSPTPGVYPDSCPSSQWCHPAIWFSVVPFSSCPQSLPASESFPMSQLLHEVAKVQEFQLYHHYFQRTPRADLLPNGQVGSPCSPRDSQESSPTPQFKSINLRRSAFFTVQLRVHLAMSKNIFGCHNCCKVWWKGRVKLLLTSSR